MQTPPLALIFGTGRNGSTLLMRLLDGSPGLHVYPLELNWLNDRERIVVPLGFDPWAGIQLRTLEETYLHHLPTLPDEALAPAATAGGTPEEQLYRFVEGVGNRYSNVGGNRERTLLAKSVEVGRIDEYIALMPHARFVHLLRHPYQAYASLKRTDMVQKMQPFWYQGGDLLREFIENRWLPHAKYALAAVHRDPAHHKLATYEELVASPDRVVADLAQWLGVEPPPEPGVQTTLGGYHVQLPYNSSEPGVGAPLEVVADMASTYKYSDVLEQRERDWITYRAGSAARLLGYAVDERRSRAALALEWVLPGAWERRNAPISSRLVRALARRRLYMAKRLVR